MSQPSSCFTSRSFFPERLPDTSGPELTGFFNGNQNEVKSGGCFFQDLIKDNLQMLGFYGEAKPYIDLVLVHFPFAFKPECIGPGNVRSLILGGLRAEGG